MYHCIAFCEASAESDRDEGDMSEDSKQISSEEYIAHINEYSGQVQSVKEHSENTARLCREFSVAELEDFMYALGLQHDIGKYQQSFQKRIRGASVRVEHSGCGALAAEEQYPVPMSLMMAYCIAGHHSGIPDGGFANDTADVTTLAGRLKRNFEDFSTYKDDLEFPEVNAKEWVSYLIRDFERCPEMLVDKFAFLTRYAFSCLVDADSMDTADFCKEKELPKRLRADFASCLEKVNRKFDSFVCETKLQKTRSLLQEQAFARAQEDGEIYLLNMPTGSGKTLASVKVALERAIAGKKKRIIYVIPYNSIIEQTAEVFGELFGDDVEILRHQSTFSYEDAENVSEDYRESAKTAMENWDAPFIITTAVQFFESVYSNKRGKLRKMHNMADSILIFDEAHLMPQDYLQPCLQAIAFLTRYLHSEAVFLTATMPDYRRLIQTYALPDANIIDLIEDKSQFKQFQKCRYTYLGEMDSISLLTHAHNSPSKLIIVNKKATARKLYQECSGLKFHLSTYMTSLDRTRVLGDIYAELRRLEEDYPNLENVPEERRITIISTSLIEAGVDLDVHTVYRETAGLDSILQAGGRCNREGKRAMADVFIFDLADEAKRGPEDGKRSIARGLLGSYPDISDSKCIEEYYNRLYFMNEEQIQKNTMHREGSRLESIPFKSYAEKFEIIDSRTFSLVVPQDEYSRNLVEALRYTKAGNIRKFQKYCCTIQRWELEDLIRQHAVEDFGTGIYCLTNTDYYDRELGITFEAKDYFL